MNEATMHYLSTVSLLRSSDKASFDSCKENGVGSKDYIIVTDKPNTQEWGL